ncbi:MAG: ArsR family transcriptional regulator [Nitrososphaera sp.]|nr:ArsR family transcriptional regulator [Nitrososphaera sp.]
MTKKSPAARQSDHQEVGIDFVLSVLGQKKRLEILRSLLDAEAGSGVTSLAKELSVKAPTIEKHLATLKKIGLVKKQVTLDFARERWVIRGRKRISRLLNILDSEIKDLVEAGNLFEEVEKLVRRQQYYKEHESTIQEMEQIRGEGHRLDLLLERISKSYDRLLDDDEKKKINYWMSARSAGIL